jgi:hypothetical protein
MSLQREHRNGNISHGAERKITLPELINLINISYSFLKATITQEVAQFIFSSVDTDNDKLITYPEYFQVIQNYLCRNANWKEPKPQQPEQGQLRNSKLRRHIWEFLRKLYDSYVQGRSLSANDTELRGLLNFIVGDLSENDFSFIATGLSGLNWKTIDFEAFATQFIYLIAEIGLSRFASNQ